MKGSDERLTTFFEKLRADLSRVKGFPPAIERLRERAEKRARFTDPTLDEKAIRDFLSFNASLKGKTVFVQADLLAEARLFILKGLESVNTRFDENNIQVNFDFRYFLDHWGYGPGASHGTKAKHPAEKMSERWSVTRSCLPWVLRIRRNNPYFFHYDMEDGVVSLPLLRGSKLSTVPKNREKARTIGSEPLGNMAVQLSAGSCLSDALLTFGLDIRSQQPKNKALARIGSITGSVATIDLKNASDCIVPLLVRLLFPDKWYQFLMDIRSPEILVGSEWVELNMISTMGNGFTFPLMTLIIASLLYAYRRVNNGPHLYLNFRTCAIFGDDIIIEKHEYDGFCKVLEEAGFIINHDKSFADGPFRESCGGDYHEGVDITPFYVKSLDSDPEVNVAINQLLDWSSRHSVYLESSLRYLLGLLRRRLFVPEWHNPDSGILCQTVQRRYKYYAPQHVYRRLLDERYIMPLACGGYISSGKTAPVFTPRLYKTRYRVVSARMPNGYLTGEYPLLRTSQQSQVVSSYLAYAEA